MTPRRRRYASPPGRRHLGLVRGAGGPRPSGGDRAAAPYASPARPARAGHLRLVPGTGTGAGAGAAGPYTPPPPLRLVPGGPGGSAALGGGAR
jgi:hypothetical protein